MKTVTLKEFREAMVVVETYSNQVDQSESKDTTILGCRVRLSKFGLEMQGNRKKKLTGKIVDYHSWMGKTDGTVTVKWDQHRKPDSMHISQVEAI